MVVILTGVSGTGKTTVGRILAKRMGCGFYDADDLHPPANREKMRRGIALTDGDRQPWLGAVRRLVEQFLAEDSDAVIACSALKQSYRDILTADPARVRLVYLRGSKTLIAQRIRRRTGHFFNQRLLQSQFDTLEEPAGAITVEISDTPEHIAELIQAALDRTQ